MTPIACDHRSITRRSPNYQFGDWRCTDCGMSFGPLTVGLTAEGGPGPGRLRCYQLTFPDGSIGISQTADDLGLRPNVVPGWFVPDGAP